MMRKGRTILVCDSRKALLFDDFGSLLRPRLQLRSVFQAPDNPPTGQQGADRPGRTFQSVGRQRSAMEQTDWHRLAKERFADEIAAALVEINAAHGAHQLTIVSPPAFLAFLREALPVQIRLQSRSIAKDLIGLRVEEIARHLAAARSAVG